MLSMASANGSHGLTELTELHVPYKWCPRDDCECYRPECFEHGCMDVCKSCRGSGFSRLGKICDECDGQKYIWP